MSRAKRRAWHETMIRRMKSGENDVSLMWYMPVCNGRVCRERWCHGDHYIGAVPVFHGGTYQRRAHPVGYGGHEWQAQ